MSNLNETTDQPQFILNKVFDPTAMALATTQVGTDGTSLGGLEIPAHDYIGLAYTGANLTTVTYKSGGAGGTTVATLTLAYTGSQLDSVTKA